MLQVRNKQDIEAARLSSHKIHDNRLHGWEALKVHIKLAAREVQPAGVLSLQLIALHKLVQGTCWHPSIVCLAAGSSW